MKETPFEPGSICSGTMRTIDLIQEFWDAICFAGAQGEILEEFTQEEIDRALTEEAFYQDEYDDTVNQLLEMLFVKLDELAPEGYYFGANEGDGADFGFWPIDDPWSFE